MFQSTPPSRKVKSISLSRLRRLANLLQFFSPDRKYDIGNGEWRKKLCNIWGR
ncbi:MAG: hypothetical protein JRM78_00620 [Nitrososphaerota archaeon]|nr:hypothetical protein [Nitrososphaerota archaeon]